MRAAAAPACLSRAVIGAAAAIACGAAAPALADCLDWQDGAVRIESGTLQGLPPGPVRWRSGVRPAGGGHAQTSVELRWTGPDGRARRQVLFEAMQDGQPRLDIAGMRLRLRLTFCPPGAACRDATLPFAWDPAAGRFAGADRAAREALADACQGEAEE